MGYVTERVEEARSYIVTEYANRVDTDSRNAKQMHAAAAELASLNEVRSLAMSLPVPHLDYACTSLSLWPSSPRHQASTSPARRKADAHTLSPPCMAMPHPRATAA